jgi:hypothetical protein
MNPLFAMIQDPHDKDERNDYGLGKQYYIENFLKNDLGYYDKNVTQFGQLRKTGIRVDLGTEYKTNNFGFRDKDWNGSAEILAVGCSNTYGIGVPVEGTWPTIFQDMVKKEVRNLSRPGISTNELVSQLFAYFKKFGNPNFIFCLFPDPFRIKLPTNKNLMNSLMPQVNEAFAHVNLDFTHSQKISSRPQYSKKPYLYEDVIPVELPLFFSMQAIHILEQYCISNNIKLLWSTWHPDLHQVMLTVKDNPFNSFYPNEAFLVMNKITDDCHQEYKELLGKYFNHGLDTEEDLSQAHPGVHRNVHIAEAFYKKYSEA